MGSGIHLFPNTSNPLMCYDYTHAWNFSLDSNIFAYQRGSWIMEPPTDRELGEVAVEIVGQFFF